MNILLVGEYSRLHNSLKEGLEKLDHNVTIVAPFDGFKKYSVDLLISKKYQKGFKQKVKNLLYRLFDYDLESKNVKSQILKLCSQLSNYDIVQFINEAPFGCTSKIEKDIFDLITSWNKTTYLLSCGTDYISVSYAKEEKFRYSILTPYKNGKDKNSISAYGLQYITPEFKTLHKHIYKNIEGVIASDIDYHLPLKNHPKYLGLIPNPINTEILHYKKPEIKGKIVIFHGINSHNYYKKGNDIFEEALAIVKKTHSKSIIITTVRSLPYSDYIKAYDEAHILLDQIYAYDQGYNALEAMAKGKVVFTGAEQEWLEHYNLEEDTIAINALPDAKAIAKKLEWLITNPNKIIEISKNARQFIEKHHHYISSAEKYLNTWTNNKK
ncbi:glycosyltransferase [Winogradskyella sp.]|jgi:glycosyltransferase involved in cell wall biosynthesis|uniref:glycosyltransferase n=1 Tax=Winogradskyella sp. TaxID=1883156 RepID=UPI0025EF73BE|nr:glycosyltransferase [Winogradskyella sp.]MCT4629275.1 glycosyltransferase [Winogradskyella sp.]